MESSAVHEHELSALVSIGLPVHNGSEYLAAAIDSLRAQTYHDIEILISDNASTDSTERICREMSCHDTRITYSRLDQNIGGVRNHERVRRLATGSYFMWASSDDIWHPQYVEKCVDALSKDCGATVAYSINGQIDGAGTRMANARSVPAADSDDVLSRWIVLTDIYRPIEPFYGVMRRRFTDLVAPLQLHPGFDRLFLAELGLLGKLIRISEPLYFRRIHQLQSVNAYPSLHARYAWINPQLARARVMPHFAYLKKYIGAAMRSASGSRTKTRCLWHMARWCKWHRRELWDDLRKVIQ